MDGFVVLHKTCGIFNKYVLYEGIIYAILNHIHLDFYTLYKNTVKLITCLDLLSLLRNCVP
jgi:hypothetical protein